MLWRALQTKKIFSFVFGLSDFFVFFVLFGGGGELLRGVRSSAADADVGVSDEGDALDNLLPGALEPRVFASHCESAVRVLES